MVSIQAAQAVVVVEPVVLNNTSLTSKVIDTTAIYSAAQGAQAYAGQANKVRIAVILGHLSDVNFTTLKLQWSDASGSGFVDVPNSLFGTSTDIYGVASTLPAFATYATNPGIVGWEVDLQPGLRYFKIVGTVGGTTGTTGWPIAAFAELDRIQQTPSPQNVAQGFDQLLTCPTNS